MRLNWAWGLVGVALLGHAAAAASSPARERRLHVASAEASSYLVNDCNKFQENYLPLYVGDDDPKTAWTLKTEGIGEWLRVHVTPMAGATKVRLKVRNGYQKSDKLWAANSRAQGLTVVLLPSKKSVDVELKDASGWQEVAVEQPAGALDAVELRVRSVYAGKKYDDLVLSDVQVLVTATTPDNPAFEKQRLQKIADWKKERLEAAKLFATKLGQALPVASTYLQQEVDEHRQDPPKCDDVLCWMKVGLALAQQGKVDQKVAASLTLANALARTNFSELVPARVSTRDKRPVPRADGVCTPKLSACFDEYCTEQVPLPRQLGFLNAESLVTTEQSGLPSIRDVLDLKPKECRRGEATTFAWIARDAAGDAGTAPARAVLLAVCGMVEGREGSYPASQVELLVYGKGGQLEVMADTNNATTYRWDRDAAAPRLVGARVTNAYSGDGASFEGVTAVAAKQ